VAQSSGSRPPAPGSSSRLAGLAQLLRSHSGFADVVGSLEEGHGATIGGTWGSSSALAAIGVTADGKRSVLGCSVSRSEAETHWREFLQSLQERGLYGVKLVVSDNHAGLKAARHATMPGIPWQRCQFHTSQNAMAHIPKMAMRVDVADDIRRIYNAEDRAEADRRLKDMVGRYHKTAPALASWLEENIPEALTVFAFPAAHRKRLRTNNGLERLNKEIKRRTRVATLFPNEASVLRLVSAVLSEISDDWETERSYLNMKAR